VNVAGANESMRPRAPALNPSALPPPENRLYYPALDGLRAIAVLMVFSTHYLWQWLPRSLNWGRVGVDIFFVLSGFLITGILYDSSDRKDRYGVFYKRRALRIFPLYFLVLLLPVCLEPWFRWRLHPALCLWPVYAGNYARFLWPMDVHSTETAFETLRSTRVGLEPFTWHLDHLWSLCIEEQFYLVWPLVVNSLSDRRKLRNLCIAAVILVLLLRCLCTFLLPERWSDLGLLYFATPLRSDSLLLGGAIALALRGPERKYISTLARPLALLLVVSFAAWEALSYQRFGHLIDPVWSSFHNPTYATFAALLAAVLIAMSIDPTRGLYRGLNTRVLRAIGQRSYGFYVYHLVLISVFAEIARAISFGHKGIAGALLPLVAFAGTLTVSWISFRYFEAPLLRLKARFAR
jgi:peptidoglycan/LPS O-acetylase OafA/YrhL